MSGLFDTLTFTAFLHILRKAVTWSEPKAQPNKAKPQRGATGRRKDPMDDSEASSDDFEQDEEMLSSVTPRGGMDGLSLCVQILSDLSLLVKV